MLIHLLIIAIVAGLLYWAVNRLPVIAPTVKQIVKIAIVVVACLLILSALTGWHIPGT